MNLSRGLRNNNPLNIRHSADKWEGTRIVQTDKSFVQFTSMAYGYRAAGGFGRSHDSADGGISCMAGTVKLNMNI